MNIENPTQHPDDIAVDRFAAAMKAKLAQKRAEGRGGWDNTTQCPPGRLQQMLINHISKGDPIDVGNFAMMIWNRSEDLLTSDKKHPKTGAATEPAYSTDGEIFPFESLEEALTYLHDNDYLHAGRTIERGTATRFPPSHYFNVDDIIDRLSNDATDECGEVAEFFPDLDKAEIAELDALVSTWLDLHLRADFFPVTNTETVQITQAMIDEFLAGQA